MFSVVYTISNLEFAYFQYMQNAFVERKKYQLRPVIDMAHTNQQTLASDLMSQARSGLLLFTIFLDLEPRVKEILF